MPLSQQVVQALRDPHDVEAAVSALTAHLAAMADATQREHIAHVVPTAERVIGVRTPDLRRTAREISRVLREDDHQLAKVMAGLWRGPAVEHRTIAALCCDALGEADLKRLLRFLQQAERKLNDWAACDALVTGCRRHIRVHPDLFLREARNRIASRRPYVKRLGIVMLTPLATDAAFHDLSALVTALRPCMTSEERVVQKACAWLLRDVCRRDTGLVEAFLREYVDVPAAQGTLSAYRQKARAVPRSE